MKLLAMFLLVIAGSAGAAPTTKRIEKLERLVAQQAALMEELRTERTQAPPPTPPPPAPPPPPDKRVDELWKAKEEAAKKEAKKLTTTKTFGRIHLDQWGFPRTDRAIDAFENPATGADPEDRFEFRRLRIGVSGDIKDDMVYKIELEFADPHNATFKDAYIGWKHVPVLHTVLLGNQKRPIGLDHLNSSRVTPLMERPLPVEAFNEDARRFGVAAYGDAKNGSGLNWRAGVFRLENASDDGRVIGDSHQLSLNARVAATPLWKRGGRDYVHVGLAGMHGNPDGLRGANDTNANDGRFRTRGEARTNNRWLDTGAIARAEEFDTAGTELVVNLGPVALTGEALQSWTNRIGDPQDLHFHGSYVMATWFLTGEHQTFDRKEGTLDRVHPRRNFRFDHGKVLPGAFELAARYSHLDLTDRDIRGGIGNNVTVGFNWLWNPHARMQFNYVFGNIHDHAPVRVETAGDYEVWGTRWMVDF